MSKSLKNFITIDVGRHIYVAPVYLSPFALSGNSSKIYSTPAKTCILNPALECKS